MPVLWLVLGAAAGATAYWLGSRALRGTSGRRQHDENEERYRAWRGRAAPRPTAPARPALGAGERRDLAAAVALAAVAIGSLIAFFLTTG